MAHTSILRVIVLLWLASSAAVAQQNRYMVFFSDKSGTPYDVSHPQDYLSERALDRRIRQGITISERDLPVNPAYVAGVRDAGADVFFRTRWMNGVLIQCEESVLPAVRSLPYVDSIEFVAPQARLQPGGSRRSFNLRRKNSNSGTETENQLSMLGIHRMHEAGYRGKGVVIAIMDSGFPGVDTAAPFAHIFSAGNFMESVSHDFVHNSADVFKYDDHGTEVLSVIAAGIPDAFVGGAPEATFQLFITEEVPTEYRVEEYNWLFAAERADSAGVDIIHTSLGYYDFDDAAMNYTREQMDGKTTVISRAAHWAAARGILVVTSAGNEGAISSWRIVTAPADAEDVLAIGGVNNNLQKTSSSSIGPTADDRIKPDLVALGASVRVVGTDGRISSLSGTSLAAPLVTSLAAGVLQRYPNLTTKEIINVLKQTASQGRQPDNLLGYGIPDFQAVVNFQERAPQKERFEIFPNPLVEDTLVISPFDPDTIESCEIEVISSQGQLLATLEARFNWLNKTYKADLSGLASGIYYIRIFSEKRRHTFKLLRL